MGGRREGMQAERRKGTWGAWGSAMGASAAVAMMVAVAMGVSPLAVHFDALLPRFLVLVSAPSSRSPRLFVFMPFPSLPMRPFPL